MTTPVETSLAPTSESQMTIFRIMITIIHIVNIYSTTNQIITSYKSSILVVGVMSNVVKQAISSINILVVKKFMDEKRSTNVFLSYIIRPISPIHITNTLVTLSFSE